MAPGPQPTRVSRSCRLFESPRTTERCDPRYHFLGRGREKGGKETTGSSCELGRLAGGLERVALSPGDRDDVACLVGMKVAGRSTSCQERAVSSRVLSGRVWEDCLSASCPLQRGAGEVVSGRGNWV